MGLFDFWQFSRTYTWPLPALSINEAIVSGCLLPLQTSPVSINLDLPNSLTFENTYAFNFYQFSFIQDLVRALNTTSDRILISKIDNLVIAGKIISTVWPIIRSGNWSNLPKFQEAPHTAYSALAAEGTSTSHGMNTLATPTSITIHILPSVDSTQPSTTVLAQNLKSQINDPNSLVSQGATTSSIQSASSSDVDLGNGSSNSSNSGLSTGAIVAIVVCSIVGAALIAVGVIFALKKKQTSSSSDKSSNYAAKPAISMTSPVAPPTTTSAPQTMTAVLPPVPTRTTPPPPPPPVAARPMPPPVPTRA